MAACTLKIELEDPTAMHLGGETVAGTVVVTTTDVVKCSGLVVSTCWTTHGRGNVDKGEADKQVVFGGTWDPQHEYRYPFTLRCAHWPPTYYGTYLSISHFVAAQANVPWSRDPKASREITVVASEAPADQRPARRTGTRIPSWIGWPLGIGLLLIFGAMFSVLLVILLPIACVGIGAYWFVRIFLPRRMLGKVEFTAEPTRVVAGTAVTARLRFTPPRSAVTEGIEWTVTCAEVCTSGSGSNRQMHRHEVLRLRQQIAEAGTFPVGLPQLFEFSSVIPDDAPATLKLSDNELTWQGELRIAIPRWPDWVKKVPLTVAPSGKAGSAAPQAGAVEPGEEGARPSPAVNDEEAWFAQMLEQVERSDDDPGRLKMVLDAVRDQPFRLRVDLAREAAEAPAHAPPEPGTWTFAVYRPRDVRLCLFWPAPLRPPAQRQTGWRGYATVVGYDDRADCLLMRVTSPE